ncbi:acyltransferase family protein [Flavobacterium crassostreae]|uniref:Acyltransferase 3 domain-containing protein n=1 Tax=Flavobacterium crassostreae TaxID=1763534 RepID=A0A1B9E5S4_9FLAO|nr:acyltransferase [Flavobacterium crassostreae]OCB77296.1 hypothetical protein LPBF_04700 [Flavobacterium crassostreae]
MHKTINQNCFDFLRFFFCVHIALSHLAELSQAQKLAFILDYANSSLGVCGFFVISGFLVAKSYTSTPSLKKYFIKRAKRILPAYFFMVLFAAIILSVFSSLSIGGYFSDTDLFKYIGWNLVFMNFVQPCLPGLFENNLLCAVNGSLWTLKVEEGFYLILPIIFYFIQKTKKAHALLLTLYLFSILYWFVMDSWFNLPVLAKQLPGYLAYFSVGIGLFLNLGIVLQNKTKLFLIAVFGIAIDHYANFQVQFLYPAAFGIVVILAAYSLPFLNNFGKYGDFTYGVYIVHFPLIQLFRQYDLFEKYNPFWMAFYILVLSIAFAIFSWFGIEKRFLDRYKTANQQLAT